VNERSSPTRNIDTNRLQILIALSIWAIWKARNKRAMDPEGPNDAKNMFIESLKDIITKTWNATSFDTKKRRPMQEARIQALWGEIATLQRGKSPTFDFERVSQV
jgi:hypothetical protein